MGKAHDSVFLPEKEVERVSKSDEIEKEKEGGCNDVGKKDDERAWE